MQRFFVEAQGLWGLGLLGFGVCRALVLLGFLGGFWGPDPFRVWGLGFRVSGVGFRV